MKEFTVAFSLVPRKGSGHETSLNFYFGTRIQSHCVTWMVGLGWGGGGGGAGWHLYTITVKK